MEIAVLVGSLRKESLNRKVAKALISLAPPGLAMELVEIGDLPFYNEDLDGASPPAAWVAFRKKLNSFEGVLFVTPEYNRSVSAVLKNALDVGSRPYGASVWSAKAGAVVSVSPGALGGFGANHHLRQCLVFLDIPTLQQPEAYLGNAGDLFDPQGSLRDEKTKEFLRKFVVAYAAWVAKIRGSVL